MSVAFGHTAPPHALAPKFGALLLAASNPTLNQKAVKGQQFEFDELETHLANVPKTDSFIVECGNDRNPNNYRIHIYSFPLKHLEKKEGSEAITKKFPPSVWYNWQKTVIVPAAELLTKKTKDALTAILTKMASLQYTVDDLDEITLT
ncbi:MAG: hypothetical protein QE263_02255 [Vampirovibrionales bacterium]|nr:hypothetical protein [Vampirovibrionales bacterium]